MSLSKEILEGKKEGVEKLLQNGAPVNISDEYGYTPLIHATATRKPDLVKLLLKHNAHPDTMDMSGNTALHWAVDVDDLEITKLLLNAGAEPNAYTPMGQPVLFYPYLRKNREIVDALTQRGASMQYVNDFVQNKLLAHRFELKGASDIVTPEGLFLSMDLEGFYLEFTLDILCDSLKRFSKSYVANRMNLPSNQLEQIIQAFMNAQKIRAYKHFTKKRTVNDEILNKLLDKDLLLLPVSYMGHAITFIKYGNFFAKCDRGVQKMTDPIVIHKMTHPENLTNKFYFDLLYKAQTDKFMKKDVFKILGLQPYKELPIKHQITGNCSWANTEASVPTMLYILLHERLKDKAAADKLIGSIMNFYRSWLEWDRDRAIEDYVIDFDKLSFQRQKAKACLLGVVLFQALSPNRPADVKRAKKILDILSRKEYHYIIRTYINHFVRGRRTPEGKSFQQMIETCGYRLGQFAY